MNINEINQWLALVVTVGGLALTAIGYTYTVRSQVSSALDRLKDLSTRIEKVEAENSKTIDMLMDIKVQISALEVTLRLLFKNK